MKHPIIYISLLLFTLCFIACDPENVIVTKPVVDSDTLDYEWDSSKVIKITLNGTSISTDSKNVTVAGSTLTIIKKGTYELTGSLSNGQIIVNTSGVVRLLLNNVNITNTSTSPLFVFDAKKTILILPQGSDNTFTDGNNYTQTPDSLNATIYSKDYLAIFGTGKLTVNGNYNGGISGRDELVIESGNITVNSVGFGIKGKDYLKIQGGDINVYSGADGLKSDKDSTINEGFIVINGGNFNVVANNDAIAAQSVLTINNGDFNLISGGGSDFTPGTSSSRGLKSEQNIILNGGTFYINSADDCIGGSQHIEINNGNFMLLSANKPIDSDSTLTVNNGEINITKAIKGISSHKIKLNGGKINIASRNDCVKATKGNDIATADGSSIEINGNTLLLSSEKGDALDSNGSISIKSGTVVIQGSPTLPDDAISYRKSFTIEGGTVIASGATSLLPGTSSAQNAVFIKFKSILAPGTIINIQNASGTSICTYKTTKHSYFAFVSTLALVNGTYNVFTDGTVSGEHSNGYYPLGIYTAGTKRGSFTIAGKLTSIEL